MMEVISRRDWRKLDTQVTSIDVVDDGAAHGVDALHYTLYRG